MRACILFRKAVDHFVRIGGRLTFPVLCNHAFLFSSKLGQWE
jgi:hypothetical protein